MFIFLVHWILWLDPILVQLKLVFCLMYYFINYDSFLILGDGRRRTLISNPRPLYHQGKDH